MKTLFLAFLLLAPTFVVGAREEVDDRSPDGLLAVRRTLSEFGLERAELIALPSRRRVVELLPSGLGAQFLSILWRADSQWFAAYYGCGRVGETRVWRKMDSKFSEVALPCIRLPFNAEAEHGQSVGDELEPLRWTRTGALVLHRHGRVFLGSARGVPTWVDFDYKIVVSFDARQRATTTSIKKKLLKYVTEKDPLYLRSDES